MSVYIRCKVESGLVILESDEKLTEPKIVTLTGADTDCRRLDCIRKDGRYHITFEASSLEKWSPDTPVLYQLKAGSLTERFGFCELKTFSNTDVLLNGERCYLRGYIRGIVAHEHPNMTGGTLKDAAVKNIRQAKINVPILMLTAKGTISDKTSGFDSGADDYLVKPFDIQEVLLRIRVLLRRNQPQEETLTSNEILEAGEIEILPDTLETIILNKRMKLTPTEFEILYCLLQHFNKPVTLATLLEEVWGYSSDEDVRMLRVHVGALRNKIEPDAKNPKYLHTVTNVGYKLTPFGG